MLMGVSRKEGDDLPDPPDAALAEDNPEVDAGQTAPLLTNGYSRSPFASQSKHRN